MDTSGDQARDLGRAFTRTVSSADELGDEVDDAADAARRFRRQVDQADDSADRTRKSFGSLRSSLIGLAGTVGAALGIREIVQFARSSIDSFTAVNESVNAVNVIFEEGADSVLAFGEAAAESAGLARSQFNQLVVPIGALLRNFGFDARTAADGAVELTQRAADLASVFNVDVSEALGAVQAALRGEADPLERFGASITAARVEAFALSEGLAATKGEITDQIKVQARLGLILEDTAKVQGDFANTSGEVANRQRILAARLEETRAAIGEALLPAFEALLDVVPEVLDDLERLGPAFAEAAEAAVRAAPGVVGFFSGVVDFANRAIISTQILETQLRAIPTQLSFVADIGGLEVEGPAQRAVKALVRSLGVDDLVDLLNGDLDNAVEQQIALAKELAGEYAQLDLITSIQAGIEPAEALLGVLGSLRDGIREFDDDEFEGLFDSLLGLSGLSGSELTGFLRQLIVEADRFNLTAGQIGVLRSEFALLDDQVRRSTGGTWGPFGDILTDTTVNLDSVGDAAADNLISLIDLRRVAEEAGVSISEAIGSDLFQDFEGVEFTGLAQIEAQLESFRDRINEIGTEIDPLGGAADQVELSKEEFLENIRESVEQRIEFEANLEILRITAPNLADLIEEFGIGYDELLAEAVEDPDFAEAGEEALTAEVEAMLDEAETKIRVAKLGDGVGDSITDSVTDGLNPEAIAGLLGEAAISGGTAAVDALRAQFPLFQSVGFEIGSVFDRGLRESDGFQLGAQGLVDDFEDEIDFNRLEELGFDISAAIAAGALRGESTISAAGSRLADVLEKAVAEGLAIESPSRVMIRLGELAAEGLAEGFASFEGFQVPITSLPSSTVASQTSPSQSGGISIENTINNPVSRALPEDAATLAQLTGASAALLRGRL